METGESNISDISTSAIETEEGGATAGSPPADPSDEVPHARGPPVLGVKDLGLQDGQGVEMALSEQEAKGAGSDGAAADTQPQVSASGATTESQADGGSTTADKDGDIVLAEPQATKDEAKTEDTTAADSIKTSEVEKE